MSRGIWGAICLTLALSMGCVCEVSYWCVDLSPDGQYMAIAGAEDEDGIIEIYNAATKTLVHTTTLADFNFTTVSFSPDGKWLASSGPDNSARLWKFPSMALARTLGGPANAAERRDWRDYLITMWAVAFSPDGQLLAAASTDNTVKLWDAASGGLVRTLGEPCIAYHEPNLRDSASTFCVAFSPDGKTVAAGGDYWPDFNMSEHWGTLRIWDVATGSLLHGLRCPDQVNSIVFSPDGKALASAGRDGNVALWEVSTGRRVRTAGSHGDRLNCVAFSPDGSLLAACGRDGTGGNPPAKVWNAATGALVDSFSSPWDEPMSLAFSIDGTWLVSVGLDGDIYTYVVPGE